MLETRVFRNRTHRWKTRRPASYSRAAPFLLASTPRRLPGRQGERRPATREHRRGRAPNSPANMPSIVAVPPEGSFPAENRSSGSCPFATGTQSVKCSSLPMSDTGRARSDPGRVSCWRSIKTWSLNSRTGACLASACGAGAHPIVGFSSAVTMTARQTNCDATVIGKCRM